MQSATLRRIADELKAGRNPHLSVEDFPCFAEGAASDNPHLAPSVLERISSELTAEDAVVFERAAQAVDQGELAWVGFKVVYDADAAQRNVDNEVTKKYGDMGSADGSDLVFFLNDDKQAVAARAWSDRDFFQMKDVTRGPSMHNDQFDGLTWASVPLFDAVRVWLVGASDVAVETAAYAHHLGFLVDVIDDDPAFASQERFPDATRHVIGSFDELDDLGLRPDDYVCVLTRGHMHDPEGCLWAVRHGVHYVGMMGCAGKNNRVHDLCVSAGMTEGQWEDVKRPIGLKFGAKTPAELGLAIAAELVDVRYRQRYSEAARAKHEADLGR